MKILVTGASGFVGSELIKTLSNKSEYEVIAVFRDNPIAKQETIKYHICHDINLTTEWCDALKGVDTIIHTAARAHIMNEKAKDDLLAYRRINVEGTLNLAEQASKIGVRRFIFLSSIGVNGMMTISNEVFKADCNPNPGDAYSVSKLEAEVGLNSIANNSNMEVVNIRPPLIYGPNAKGSLLKLLDIINLNIPLPFGNIKNKRSYVSLDNLIDLIITCIKHPNAANNTFLVSDDEDLSTSELIIKMSKSFGRNKIFSFPINIMDIGAKLIGKGEEAHKLFGNMQIDITKTKNILNWKPPYSVEEGLNKTVNWYLEQR